MSVGDCVENAGAAEAAAAGAADGDGDGEGGGDGGDGRRTAAGDGDGDRDGEDGDVGCDGGDGWRRRKSGRGRDRATCDATRTARQRPSSGRRTPGRGPPTGHLVLLRRRLPRRRFRQGCPTRRLAI